jgi:hypothetical protein
MTKEFKKSIIPKEIRLPDGRTYELKTLLNKTKNRASHNLKSGRTIKSTTRTHLPTTPYKYSIEERVWQATNSPEAIQEKYNITLKQAQHIRYNARYIVDKLEINDNISNTSR